MFILLFHQDYTTSINSYHVYVLFHQDYNTIITTHHVYVLFRKDSTPTQ